VPFNGPRDFDRMSAELLIAHSLSQLRLTPTRTRILVFVVGCIALTVILAASTSVPTPWAASLAVAAGVLLCVVVPASRLTVIVQDKLDGSKRVPFAKNTWAQGRQILAEDIRAGAWACRTADHKAATVEYRRHHGRSAREPKAHFRLVSAFVRRSGSKLSVSFSDGSVEHWNPQSHIVVIDWPEPRRLGSLTNSPETLKELVRILAARPNGEFSFDQLISVAHSRHCSRDAINLAFAAAQK
jgi:hypothetical protein